ncbi:MAG: GFA family protein [Gammaproteobacteria bacterium]
MGNISGSYLCKGVQFEADSIRGPGTACHCIMCQKSHGGPFGAYVTLDGFRWTSGEDLITTYQSSEHCSRSFCNRCGSTIQFYDTRNREYCTERPGWRSWRQDRITYLCGYPG